MGDQEELSEGVVVGDLGPELQKVHDVGAYHVVPVVLGIELDDARHHLSAHLGTAVVIYLGQKGKAL